MSDFTQFTHAMSREDVETISDPGGMGMGDFGQNELGDNCQNQTPPELTTVAGFSLERYWSNFDGNCQRLTGSVHTLDMSVPDSRVTTDAPATQVQVVIQTGDDDLRGGGNPGENANVTLHFRGGKHYYS
jgi:hypothetical protein